MKSQLFLKTLAGLAVLVSFASTANVSVIVHPSNTATLDAVSISRIYLGKTKSFSTGDQIVAINQAANSKVGIEFSNKVLKKSPSQLRAYWSKLVFTGKGSPPQSVMSDQEVIELVSNNPNMIGYIKGTPTGNVKQVASF